MKTVKNYLSLITFSHTIFAFPFAMIGFVLGAYDTGFIGNAERGFFPDAPQTSWELMKRLIFVVCCMVFARSAAMAFNRYLDAPIDALNPRTAKREIPAGIIPRKNALIFTVVNSLAFILCTWFINKICFFLSPVALFVILFYSYTKRFTALCHLVLGLGLSLAPVGAYLAVTGVFHLIPVLMGLSVITWVAGFDIIYSLQDEEFDRSENLSSIPVWLGKQNALRFSAVLHVISAGALLASGLLGDFGFLYWAGYAVYCGMLLYQHSLVSPADLSRVNIAFMTANGIASLVFALFVIADILT